MKNFLQKRSSNQEIKKMISTTAAKFFKAIIHGKITFSCSAKSIYKFIEKQSHKGKNTFVREYCKEHKATIRVTCSLALSAQENLKEEMQLISKYWEIIQFNISLYILSFSKKKIYHPCVSIS